MATHVTEIAQWEGRIAMSSAQRLDDLEVRKKFTRWYNNDYWGGGVTGMKEDDPNKRQTNYVGMFVRAMESNLYAQPPTFSCVTPGNPNALNQLFSITAGNIPEHVGLRRTVRNCSLDAILGRFGIAQVGYDAQFGWNSSLEDSERQKAQEENELFGREDVRVKPYEAHDIHVKEHATVIQQLQQASPQSPPTAVIGEIKRHIQAHTDAKEKQFESPCEYVKFGRAWVTRIHPVVDGAVAFGWETDAPFEEARWMWRAGSTPLEELKAEKGLKTGGLKASGTRRGGMSKAQFDDLSNIVKSAIEPDVEMVDWYEIVNREDGKRLIYAAGHDSWLFNERFDHADLFRALGYHKLSFLTPTDSGSGKTPSEDAASNIILINNADGMLVDVLRQSVSSKIYDQSKLAGEQAEKIQRRGIGDLIGIKFKHAVDDIRKATADIQGARLPAENLAGLNRADGGVGQAFGTGDAKLGGGDDSKTATACHVAATSTTGVMENWAKVQGVWIAEIVSDVVQVVKRHYGDRRDLQALLPVAKVEEWAALNTDMQPAPEIIRVDAGSTMPGREGQKRQEAMGMLQALAGNPLVKMRPLIEDVCAAFGKDASRYMLSPQEEQEAAAMQAGSQQEMVGEPGMAQEGGGQRPSEAQSPSDMEREVRSNAAERSADVTLGR